MTVIYVVEGAGSLIIERVEDMIVVEAIAIAEPGEPRAIVQARHAKLQGAAEELFGADIELHDPLGLRDGAKAATS
jgi:hypothetical protein